MQTPHQGAPRSPQTPQIPSADVLAHVSGGGDSYEIVTSQLIIRKVSVGDMDNNAYLLSCRVSGAQLLIDAAADAPRLLRLIREGSPTSRVDTIVTTHSHHDHWQALAPVLNATGAVTIAGAADADDIPVAISRTVEHGAIVRVGVHDLAVIGLRGHTPGSIALVWDGGEEGTWIFTGDSLFPGGLGATKGDQERFFQLFADVSSRIFEVYPDHAVVAPGHGDGTTLGTERPHLPAWRERGW